MPIYEYQCEECDTITESWQHLNDAPLSSCPECQGNLKKLISHSSFQLKGGGWYADGYSNTNKSSESSSPSTPTKSDSTSPATTSSSCPKAKSCDGSCSTAA